MRYKVFSESGKYEKDFSSYFPAYVYSQIIGFILLFQMFKGKIERVCILGYNT